MGVVRGRKDSPPDFSERLAPPALANKVSDGVRTRDPQGHNLVL